MTRWDIIGSLFYRPSAFGRVPMKIRNICMVVEVVGLLLDSSLHRQQGSPASNRSVNPVLRVSGSISCC